jgi:hypothetical protein
MEGGQWIGPISQPPPELRPSLPPSLLKHLHPSSINVRSTSQKNLFCCSWQKEVIQDAPESSVWLGEERRNEQEEQGSSLTTPKAL